MFSRHNAGLHNDKIHENSSINNASMFRVQTVQEILHLMANNYLLLKVKGLFENDVLANKVEWCNCTEIVVICDIFFAASVYS